MTEYQFTILLNLYHEFREAFVSLDQKIKDEFYDKLFDKKQIKKEEN